MISLNELFNTDEYVNASNKPHVNSSVPVYVATKRLTFELALDDYDFKSSLVPVKNENAVFMLLAKKDLASLIDKPVVAVEGIFKVYTDNKTGGVNLIPVNYKLNL